MNKKFHFVYKTICLINNKYYVGVHSTDDLNDGYIGSGKLMQKAIRKYGKENFKREIISLYDCRREALLAERELVDINETLNSNNYNLAIGGGSPSYGKVTVVDSCGNTLSVNVTDPRYISGELQSRLTGKVMVKDRCGNRLQVGKTDARYVSGELVALTKDTVMVRGENGKCFRVSKDDPRYISGELKGSTYNMVTVYNINDPSKKGFCVCKDDPKYISGEYVAKSKGRKCKESVKQEKREKYSARVWVSKNSKSLMIYSIHLESYLANGWSRGRDQLKKTNNIHF